ncbi:MAG: Zn-ribbon domain-containing OB-fold protein [Armatimonadetes bacterium]|nr:Zn-ribbon domain-containing OB-fold protein [Armatimonadota bacterium]
MTQRIASYPGTTLSEEQIEQGRVLSVHDRLRADYTWDAGLAIGLYLDGLKAGVILGVRCARCDRTVVPPRAFCEQCFAPMDAFVPLADVGIVNTFSLCYVTWDVKRIAEPLIPAVIDLDGTSPPAGIMHLLGGIAPDRVHIGMRVRAVWKPARARQGAITDIRYFKPHRRG